MKRMNRREFAKLAGGTALAAPLVSTVILPVAEGAERQEPATTPQPEKQLQLTAEQQERVKQAVERRERQLAAIRNHSLGYEAEPAFVFRARAADSQKKRS